MFISADDIVAAISYLIPGFIALKILYVFGFQSKRTDSEWAIWSLIGSAAVLPITNELAKRLLVLNPATVSDQVKTCATPILAGPADKQLAGVVACATAALNQQSSSASYLALGVLVGAGLGLFLLLAWAIIRHFWPLFAAGAYPTVWDRRLNAPKTAYWVEITTGEKRRFSGILTSVASDVESDKADLFLLRPGWLDDAGNRTAIDDVVGIWMARSEIKHMIIVGPS